MEIIEIIRNDGYYLIVILEKKHENLNILIFYK
jgi:hypothetical protein